MPGRSDLKHHAALLDRMADALGIDLQEAAIRGDLTLDELSDAVLSCTGCPDPGHCNRWLGDQAVTAEATPGYCRNRDLLATLRSRDVD